MMLAAIRRAIVGLSMLSAFSTTTMASPLPGGRPRPTATIAPPTTPAPTLAPPATPAPSLTPYPWEVLIPANSEKYLFGAASLIQNDLIVIASGYGLLHYDTKNASQTDYRVPSQPVWDVYGAAKNDIWAVGSQESAVGKVVRFDGTSWKDVNLGFNIQPRIILRAIHGTSSSNIWVTGGSGEDPTTGSSSKTGVVLFFNGRTWTKVLDVGTHYTGTAIFARGSDVWVGLVDGTLLHSSDGFKTRRIVARVGSGDDRGVYDIWDRLLPTPRICTLAAMMD
ncbi:hypothetical protein BC829DRAFT_209523 [Chytridium lagenaria]|nr:hypothetical protein BC829DRAFT_209523 [Chytridium lagenaria]